MPLQHCGCAHQIVFAQTKAKRDATEFCRIYKLLIDIARFSVEEIGRGDTNRYQIYIVQFQRD